MAQVRFAFRLLPLILLVSCGSTPQTAVIFPGQIGDFARQNVGKSGQGAAYVMGDVNPVTAAVRFGGGMASRSLAPMLDLGGDSLDTAMANVGVGIKRFYPKAALTLDEPLYLVRDGAFKPGRHQIWVYQDDFLGSTQQVAMDVVISCCNAQGQLVNVWFRHRADNPIEPDMLAFLNALPWD